MANDSIQQRGKALEDSFFRAKDKQLLDDLRAEFKTQQKRVDLAKACGLEDEFILEQLMQQGAECETMAALSLVPLVAVAWADGTMQSQERAAILEAAAAEGIADDSATHKLIASWLDESPSDELFTAWRSFAGALAESLDKDSAAAVRDKTIGRARRVAEAAGGILGMGNKISSAEAQVLEDLESAFG